MQKRGGKRREEFSGESLGLAPALFYWVIIDYFYYCMEDCHPHTTTKKNRLPRSTIDASRLPTPLLLL